MNGPIDKRIYMALKCQDGWDEDPSGTGSGYIYTGDRRYNPFVGAVGGLDVLAACDCNEIGVSPEADGKRRKVDPCNPPKCMKDVPGYRSNCKKEVVVKEKKKKKEVNKTEFGSEKETAVVRAFLKYIRDISLDEMYIKGDEKSENKFDDYNLGDAEFKDLIRPENKSFEDLKEKAELLKKELADKLSVKKN
jgi:hypothetical protein